ncbi:MAG: chemotaxis protein CheB [Rubrivivax sp.]|nr:chemotaxis protein CheB [Rubrivivax sp.]
MTTPAATHFAVVGLGASAGGLEALEQFFRHTLPDSGMAYVVVQHLDPSHASILSEILQRSTAMPVVEAQDSMPVLPDRVHVIPPNRDMVMVEGALRLSLPSEPRGQRLPIDAFLRSLAEDRGEDAAAIILSGTGTDGTLGLRAVFGAGGLCLVQEPATARYDGMPASAIKAGYATHVLPVDRMPRALRDGRRPQPGRTGTTAPPAVGWARVLTLLRTATGHDFSLYKQSTIGRRIERRMAMHGIESVEAYARHLREHPAEMTSLFRELLINVTSFFRDTDAFAILRNTVLPELLRGKAEGSVLRVWVAGCATGEEAYSIAMLLREVMDELQLELKVQLYATDLDDDAINTARAGLYPPNIAQDVSPERLRRFFTKDNTGYRVRKEIREMVVFAVQSVIKDPPFTRLDLLSCRNLMIYLEPELQNRLIPAFHYALRPGGVLVLSPSESVGHHAELFEPIDRRVKIYRAMPSSASTRAVLGSGLSWTAESAGPVPPGPDRVPRETRIAEMARRLLLQAYAPASVVTDAQGNVLYVHGDTGRYLRPAPGQPTHSVVEMAREGLPLALREALQLAAASGQATLNRELAVKTNGSAEPVALSVRPMADPEGPPGALLVSFQDLPAPSPRRPARRTADAGEVPRVLELERELSYAKESMSAMLEEQQASNEELKSTNEELQSTNEELQSTNEELETSKEELQSVNEELVTVNSELQNKIEQMAGMQDDMKNLLDNIRVGTIFLDCQLMIRRFTRDALRVYRLTASDIGRPLADIRSELQGDDLLTDATAVLDTLVPVEREVCTAAGIWYLARIQPYRTVDNVIDGVVLTFADVTERVAAIAARKARDLAEAIVDTVHAPLLVLDGTLKVLKANPAYHRVFGGTPADTDGRPFFEATGGQWGVPAVRTWLEAGLPPGLRAAELQLGLAEGRKGAARVVRLSARRILELSGESSLLLLSFDTAAQAGGPP